MGLLQNMIVFAALLGVASAIESSHTPTLADVKKRIKGVWGPLPTLYHDNLTINVQAMHDEVNYLIEHGFVTGRGGFLVGAVGGDFPMMTIAERKLVGKTVAKAAAGRVPLVMSVQSTVLEEVIELAQFAEEVGMDAIQISPPFYWHPTEEDTFKWYEAVHKATKTILFAVYNIPWNSIDMPVDLMIRLAKNLPRCEVLKYATMRMQPQMEVIELAKYYSVIHNNDGMSIGTMISGANGFIMDFSMTWPKHAFEVYDAIIKKDYELANKLNYEVDKPYMDFFAKMNVISSGEDNILREGLEATGRYGGPPRLPSQPYTKEQRKEFRDLLKKIGMADIKPVDDELVV